LTKQGFSRKIDGQWRDERSYQPKGKNQICHRRKKEYKKVKKKGCRQLGTLAYCRNLTRNQKGLGKENRSQLILGTGGLLEDLCREKTGLYQATSSQRETRETIYPTPACFGWRRYKSRVSEKRITTFMRENRRRMHPTWLKSNEGYIPSLLRGETRPPGAIVISMMNDNLGRRESLSHLGRKAKKPLSEGG